MPAAGAQWRKKSRQRSVLDSCFDAMASANARQLNPRRNAGAATGEKPSHVLFCRAGSPRYNRYCMNKNLIALSLGGAIIASALFARAEIVITPEIKALQDAITALRKQLAELQAAGPTPPAPPASGITTAFTQTLRRGSRGTEVTRLQEFLKAVKGVYPEGIVSGYFGTLTEAAVKRFQSKYGIDTVGIVGPKTRAKLNELAAGQNCPLPPVCSGTLVWGDPAPGEA